MARAPMGNRAFIVETAKRLFDPASVLFTAVAAFFMTVGFGLMNAGALMVIGVFFLVFSTSAVVKYATMATRAIALGQAVPVASNAVFDYFVERWAFAPWIGIFALNVFGLAIWYWVGFTPAVLLAFVVVPLIPAGVAVAAVSQEFWRMFAIPQLFKIARIMGADYLRILVLWIVLILLGEILRGSGFVLSFLYVWASCLQVMAMFFATGVVSYHHHQALDVPIEKVTAETREADRQEAHWLRLRRQTLDQAYAFFSRGNTVAGLTRLKRYFEQFEEEDPDAWWWFIEEMLSWESKAPALGLARNYFSRLADNDDQATAARLLSMCLEVDPNYTVHPKDAPYARSLLTEQTIA